MTAPSPTVRWPALPTRAARTQPLPICVEPARPVSPQIMVFSPTREACPTRTKSSSLVPRPMRVSPTVARSTQELAWTSTSSSRMARPDCANLYQVPSFCFAKPKDGTWYKLAQSGRAILEDDVEVQANSCVDRATVGETRIGRGTKLDDLVLVGHASRVGENTMICGLTGLAGSTKIGNGCVLAGQVGTAGHLSVGDGAVVTAKSGIPGDIPPRSLYSGYPAIENRQWLKNTAALNRLPDLQRRVWELESEIEKLKNR